MLKAVLLDLDNTMVLYDEPAFYESYFISICRMFSDIFTPDEFKTRVIRATMALRQNNGEMSNRRFFMNMFTEGCEEREDEIWQRFMQFYETEYHKIVVEVKVPDGLHDTLERMHRDGLKLVVASNPIFPLMVQHSRMDWADIEKSRFNLVTHIDNMSFVKPRTEYYLQICEKIGEDPAGCLMVGNDAVHDMVAGAVGMKTFLTEEAGEIDYTSVIVNVDDRHQLQHIPKPDFSGAFTDVASVVRQLRG